MYIKNLFKGIVLYVIIYGISICQGDDTTVKGKCNDFIDENNTLTLNCSRRNFNSIPIDWLENLEDIEKDVNVLLTLFNNSITNITQLPSLRGHRIAISFKSNQIMEIDADAFRNIPNIVYLDMSNNSITSDVLRSEIFQGPYEDGRYADISIETLNLGYNKIHSLDRLLFQYTPNLTRLYINNNPFDLIDHVTILALSSIQNLEVLDMAFTGLDHIPLDAFKEFTKLQQIDLSGNKFTIIPESLRLVGATLEHLTINNNPIAELNDDSFIGLSNLKVLEVAENEDLVDVKRSTFTPLTSLRVLHLCHNINLRYISHNAFRNLKDKWTLKEVHLDDNDLSELPVDLMPWNKLEVLGMTDNEWLCDCDLAQIVIKEGAGSKFSAGEIPICMSPMKMSGKYLTDLSIDDCPKFDTNYKSGSKSFFSGLKPKHILWSILGVALIVVIGMIIGFLVNTIKALIKNNIRSHNIRYVNIHRSSFA